MSSLMRNIFFFVLLTYSSVSITQGYCVTRTWQIYVINVIPEDIVVHIKSRDDDLGNHTISSKGNYNWSFCEDVFGRTRFYGNFWWGSDFQNLALFDNEVRGVCAPSKQDYNYCYWSVSPNGFWVSAHQDGGWVLKKTWK
ncbi:hypothetical protein LXL04_012588 [Taraxacum kok-saghyz]